MNFGVIDNIVSIFFISGEFVIVVGNIETSISSSFKSSENSVTNGGVSKTNIKNSFERSSVRNILMGRIVFSIDGALSWVQLFKGSLFKESSGEEESGGIGSRIVG